MNTVMDFDDVIVAVREAAESARTASGQGSAQFHTQSLQRAKRLEAALEFLAELRVRMSIDVPIVDDRCGTFEDGFGPREGETDG